MRCTAHRKDFVGGCNWCGSKLCEKCISKAEGKKLYCSKCVPLLGGLRRTTVPVLPQNPVTVTIMADGNVHFQPRED